MNLVLYLSSVEYEEFGMYLLLAVLIIDGARSRGIFDLERMTAGGTLPRKIEKNDLLKASPLVYNKIECGALG